MKLPALAIQITHEELVPQNSEDEPDTIRSSVTTSILAYRIRLRMRECGHAVQRLSQSEDHDREAGISEGFED